MIKSFLKDSFIYTIANVFTRGIGFLMLPIYTANFSPSEFGTMDLLLITGNIISVLFGLEIHQAVARFYPDKVTVEAKRKMISTAIITICLGYIVFLIPAILFSKQLSTYLLKIDQNSIIIWALFSYGANFIFTFVSSQLRYQLKSKEFMIVTILYSGITALGTCALIKYLHYGLNSVFIAQIVASFVGISLSVYSSRAYYELVLDIGELKEMLNFSTPLILSTLMVYAMLYTDRIMIKTLLDNNQLGLYALASRVASIVTLMTVGVQSALTPLIYNNYKSKDSKVYLAKIFNWYSGLGLFFIAILSLFSWKIVELLAPTAYVGSGALIPWVALSVLLTGLINFTPGIFIEKKTKVIFYINILSFLINMILGYIFIKKYGALGAVMATSVSALVYFLMYYFIGQKYYFIPFFWTKLKQ